MRVMTCWFGALFAVVMTMSMASSKNVRELDSSALSAVRAGDGNCEIPNWLDDGCQLCKPVAIDRWKKCDDDMTPGTFCSLNFDPFFCQAVSPYTCGGPGTIYSNDYCTVPVNPPTTCPDLSVSSTVTSTPIDPILCQ